MKIKIVFFIGIVVVPIIIVLFQLSFPETEGKPWWYVIYLPFQFCFFRILGYQLTLKNMVRWTFISIPVFLLLTFQFNLLILNKLLALIIGGLLFVIIVWVIRKIANPRITR